MLLIFFCKRMCVSVFKTSLLVFTFLVFSSCIHLYSPLLVSNYFDFFTLYSCKQSYSFSVNAFIYIHVSIYKYNEFLLILSLTISFFLFSFTFFCKRKHIFCQGSVSDNIASNHLYFQTSNF